MATNKGFTLVEIMVAVTIFSLLAVVFTGLFVNAIKMQQRSLSSQELISNVSYNLEYMSRAIRMAKKELSDPAFCLIQKGLNYEKIDESDKKGLKFIKFDHETSQDVCLEFYWDKNENRLYEAKNGEKYALTPESFKVIEFQVEDSSTWGQDQTPPIQPKVEIFLKIEGRQYGTSPRPEIEIQTTISQRNLNVQY